MIGRRIAHYEIERRLGEGGMGEVWVARDVRLGRSVALKRVRSELIDDRMRKRLWREARSAASVNHPNVCQVYDVVEDDADLYLAMELLEGDSLEQRLARGPLPVRDALAIVSEILKALGAVHDAGLVHRDLKPANVVLTAHGVKLLDFGLSRPPPTGITGTHTMITREGQVVGTPRYMSPEQWAGDGIDPRSDVFAAGAILYEMLTGLPAIAGTTIREVMEDAVAGRPPVLQGDSAITKMQRVIRRSLARPIADRYSSARAMLEDLDDESPAPTAHIERGEDRYTRLVVMPFRMLRADPEIDFLASSLPEAIIASLTSTGSMIVCSSVGPPSAHGGVDVAEIARRTDCNVVLAGTILRAGSQVRVMSQLLQAPSGNVIHAHTSQGALDDIFRLQDDITSDIVRRLPTGNEATPPKEAGRHRPSNGRAYELYLRANQLGNQRRTLPEARDLYRECLELDPGWAPAWARLGRVLRVLAKFESDDAETNFQFAQEAFRRSFELDPDLSIAHNLYTAIEVEELGRSRDAMVRLLERAKHRVTEPQLFVGLVLTCRFCGLLEESLAADRRARHLDPCVRTSVHYTYLLMGDWTRAIEYDDDKDMRYVTRLSLFALGRPESSMPGVDLDTTTLPGLERHVIEAGRAAHANRREDCVAASRVVLDSRFRDPEGRFFLVRNLCRVGEVDFALTLLRECVDRGFYPRVMMEADPWLAPLLDRPETHELMGRMDAAIEEARSRFAAAGGRDLLGVG